MHGVDWQAVQLMEGSRWAETNFREDNEHMVMHDAVACDLRDNVVYWLKPVERSVWSLSCNFQVVPHALLKIVMRLLAQRKSSLIKKIVKLLMIHTLIWSQIHTYLSLGHVDCVSCLVTVTPSDSNDVNRSAALKRFPWIIFTINQLSDRIKNFKSNAS